ncbi:MAG: glycosyltransferase family 4 protein [Ekhidna sp.]|nr:glycosyltransferase family 4 protein [Ekhidna sp.]
MRILITARNYRPKEGGIETYLHHLALEMVSQGHAICVVASYSEGGKAFDRKQPFITKRIYRRLFFTPIWTLRLFYYALSEKIDVVINGEWRSGIHTYLIRHLMPFQYFTIAHGTELQDTDITWKYRVWKRLGFLRYKILQASDGIFPNSAFTKSILKEMGLPMATTHSVNPAVDPKAFYPTQKPNDLTKKYGVKDHKVILSVSRLVPHKGHETVIRALPKVCRRIPQVKYFIAGTGPHRNYLEELVKDLNLEQYVIFTGFVTDDDLRDYYNLADVFIMLSQVREHFCQVEGFGIAFLEASACATPVIGGKSGGVEDAVLHGQTGSVIDPFSADDCANTLIQYLENSEFAMAQGKAGRLRVETELNWTATTERMLAIIEEIMR